MNRATKYVGMWLAVSLLSMCSQELLSAAAFYLAAPSFDAVGMDTMQNELAVPFDKEALDEIVDHEKERDDEELWGIIRDKFCSENFYEGIYVFLQVRKGAKYRKQKIAFLKELKKIIPMERKFKDIFSAGSYSSVPEPLKDLINSLNFREKKDLLLSLALMLAELRLVDCPLLIADHFSRNRSTTENYYNIVQTVLDFLEPENFEERRFDAVINNFINVIKDPGTKNQKSLINGVLFSQILPRSDDQEKAFDWITDLAIRLAGMNNDIYLELAAHIARQLSGPLSAYTDKTPKSEVSKNEFVQCNRIVSIGKAVIENPLARHALYSEDIILDLVQISPLHACLLSACFLTARDEQGRRKHNFSKGGASLYKYLKNAIPQVHNSEYLDDAMKGQLKALEHILHLADKAAELRKEPRDVDQSN